MLTPDRPPPEDYYQNNSRSLFGFVLERYAELLDDDARRQLHRFNELSDDAQRLFARLLTRKGPLIRVDSLKYAEISSCERALAELAAAQFIRRRPAVPADQVLALLKKSELLDFAGQYLPSSLHLPKQMRKEQMMCALLSHRADAQLQRPLADALDWLQIADPSLWWLVRLLYFGDAVQDWSAFVIRDLGMVRYETVAMRSQRFSSHADLQVDLTYRRYSNLSRRIDEFPGLAEDLLARIAAAEAAQQRPVDRFVRARRNRTLVRIGRWHERLQQPQLACQAYASVPLHPARERMVRVLHKYGEADAAASWLAKIRSQPLSDEEAQFAERFGKRGAGYQPPVTELGIEAVRTDVEQQGLELFLQHAEQETRQQPGQVAERVVRQEQVDPDYMWGAHVENSLVRTLTGLLYWEAIFADVPGAFTNPFQFGPNDLYQEDFAEPRRHIIERIEADLQHDKELVTALLTTSEQKQGIANALVNWRLLEHIPLAEFLRAMPADDIRKLCHFMIRNLAERKSGLPDLFVAYAPQRYEFVEVKGPNDQLQPGQRVWLQHFERLGIPARVLKLKVNT